MSGECEECGEHILDCLCKGRISLSVGEMVVSEEIQSRLAPIIIEHLDTKLALIDALNWILTVIVNDHERNLDVYGRSWRAKELSWYDVGDQFNSWPCAPKMVEGDEEMPGGYICRACAMKYGAVPPRDHECTWHRGICVYCEEEANLCHTSDWNWPDMRYLEENREF